MIDPRIIEWIEDGCPGEGDFCLHVPSFILTGFLRRKKIENLITFLVSDLVLQIKDGDKPTIEEIKEVCEALMIDRKVTKEKADALAKAALDAGLKNGPLPEASKILNLPPRKKNDQD